ncbi:glucan biosynthesis protein [Vreelandella sp. EE22]
MSLAMLSAPFAQASEEMFDDVVARAEALARAPYEAPPSALPSALENLSYDTYRQIRFDPERAYWRNDSPFSLQLFHSGFLFPDPVKINIVDNGSVEPLIFNSEDYTYEGDAQALLEHDLTGSGHAGFRLHYPINGEQYHDEVAVFLGSNYFRLVGRNQAYGLSTRGLAINTAMAVEEEFPEFREFWFFKPGEDDSAITFLALMDSPSLSGAYRFTLTPGEQTHLEVNAEIFARQDIGKLGVAPLTSMFTFGEATPSPPEDFRPQVHDSDGLLLQTGAGEWIWRPLNNPDQLRLSMFSDDNPFGFGLMQRERDFGHYLDMEAQYHRRPSQWVEPLQQWGPGHVELVEISTPDETHDNIVAYWVFDTPLKAGDSQSLHYRTYTLDDSPEDNALAQVIRTRQGLAGIRGKATPVDERERQFIVDFEGGELDALSGDENVALFIETSTGDVREPHVLALPDQRWRASFRVPANAVSDIRLRLELNDQPISETWNYVWYPDV